MYKFTKFDKANMEIAYLTAILSYCQRRQVGAVIVKDDRVIANGFNGSRDNYQLVLMPEVNLSRTTIRKKLENTPGLQRAINITSEMLQLQHFKPGWWTMYECDIHDLYKGLIEKGFDWNEILTKTRGWYSLDVNHPIKELSVIDLIRMYKQDYIPYWMDPVTKRIKV
jgi:hypothetical protein